MGYELIICEKPSAANKIANALAEGKPTKKNIQGVPYYELNRNGKEIIVAAAAGHLYGLSEKKSNQEKKVRFRYPVYEIEWRPSYEINNSASFSRKYLNALKKLCKEADEITIATDYDIEGEVIGLNIMRYVCKRKDANRMKFSTLTKDELINSYENKAKTINWGQAKAGETRHYLDWIYGINLSRALTGAVKKAGQFKIMSIGRVQGPALKMIVDREREITAFKPTPYWQIEGTFQLDDETKITAPHEIERFLDEKEAKERAENARKNKEGIVKEVKRTKKKQLPPTPFDLGTLQTEAYRVFRIKPKETLNIAQTLYSNGYISYPRTSSQKLPLKLGHKKIISLLAKNNKYSTLITELLSSIKTLKPREGKKEDPAHPAIHPTGYKPEGLTERENKVYDLIVKRYLSLFAEPAIRESLTAKITVGEEPFIAKGTRTAEKGWHKYYEPYVNLKEEPLPNLKENEQLKVKKIRVIKKETQPPKRFTQSSIITELEKRNLGTKATRADIVENLFKRNYVRGTKNIEATALGIKTIEALEKRAPEIIDEALTSHFESEMEVIREGKKEGEEVLEDAKEKLDQTLEKFKKNEKEIGQDLLSAERQEEEERRTLGPCPKCGKGELKIIFSPKTKKRFIGCTNYPDCDLTMPIPQSEIIPTDDKCPECGYPMVEIRNKRGTQKICVNINCPSKTKTLNNTKDNNQKKDSDEKNSLKENNNQATEKKCPKCGAPLVLRKGFYGEFYGCSKYPKCKYTESINKNQNQ